MAPGPTPWPPTPVPLASVSLTPGNTQHPHDPDDSGVNWESSIDFNLFQRDAHDRQQHNGQIELVPP